MSIKVTPTQGSYTEYSSLVWNISSTNTARMLSPTKVYIPWIVEYFLNKRPINTNVWTQCLAQSSFSKDYPAHSLTEKTLNKDI